MDDLGKEGAENEGPHVVYSLSDNTTKEDNVKEAKRVIQSTAMTMGRRPFIFGCPKPMAPWEAGRRGCCPLFREFGPRRSEFGRGNC
jgi:hypothetical protein